MTSNGVLETQFRALVRQQDPRVRRLAINPLLLTLLALLHRAEGRLPSLRIDLYRDCVRLLVERWRQTPLTEEEVLDVLGPVAAWIHAHQPTGLATEAEIRQQVTRSLAVWRGLDPSNLPGSFKHDVNDFLEVVRRDSGLLLARGEGLYSFVHLTFQEYFVARYLCRMRAPLPRRSPTA